MNRFSPYTIVLCSLILLILTGCEKVIKLKTDDIAPKYVIEANISDWPNDCRVIITQTISIDSPTVFSGVSNANVTIQEDNAPPVSLTEQSPGFYLNRSLRARPGHQYTLNVNMNGKEFTSTVTAPVRVAFDSLYIIDFDAFGIVRKFANIVFSDPPGTPNSYRFLQYKNGVQNSNIFIMNDDFSDGRTISTFLTFFDESDIQKINKGDTVHVQMQCIDPSVYLYFNSLNMGSTGGNEVIAPGNPVSNIKGDVLGYFNAYIRQERTVIVE